MIKNNDEMRQLTTKEQCRMKLPIFFGSRDNIYHPFKEVVGNSIDEITNNFEEGQVYITLAEEGDMLTIRDSGRGMPLTNGNGSDNAKLLFQTLFAGTKYGESTTVGTNGKQ